MGGLPSWTWAIGGSQSFPSWKSASCAPCPPGEGTALSEQGGMEAIGSGYAPEPLQGLSVNAQDSVGGCGDLLFLQSPRQASYACRLLVRAAPAPSGMTDSLSVSPRPPCRGPSFTLHRLTHQRRRAGEERKEPLSRQGRELRSRASPAAQR